MPKKGKRKPKGRPVTTSSSAAEKAAESQRESSVQADVLSKLHSADKSGIPTAMMPSEQLADPHLSQQASFEKSSKQILPVYPSTSTMSVDEAMQRMGLELKHEDTTHWPFSKRPGFGTKGRNISLVSNRFIIDIPEGNVYHYDVVISAIQTSEKEKKKYRCLNTKQSRKILEFALKGKNVLQKVRPAYDGKKNLFTRNPLPIEDTIEISVNFEDKHYIIEIKPVVKEGQSMPAISLEPLHQLFRGNITNITEEIQLGIQALETILRHGPALKYVPVYRSFYYPPNEGEVPPLGGGREIWLGYHQSLQISQWKPMINIDMSATAFYESGPLVYHIMSILFPNIPEDRVENKLRSIVALSDSQINTLLRELRNLQIEVTHLPYPRKYRIYDITSKGASEIYFDIDVNGKKEKKSVVQYFRTKYPDNKLRYPNLPCINGTKEKNTYLPLEVCNIVKGQHCNKELDDNQRRIMIKETCRAPQARFRSIRQRIQATKEDLERCESGSQSFSKEFGIRINTAPVKLNGRVLDPPYLTYTVNAKERKQFLVDGEWDMKNKTFFESCKPIQKWILISFTFSNVDLKQFSDCLQKGGSFVGIKFALPTAVKSFGVRESPSSIIDRARERIPDLELAVIVVPDKRKNKSLYREIKIFCETNIGLMTQCLSEKSASECNTNVICNLCQKINAKMGGRNNSLAPIIRPHIFQKPVIVIGADCTHPAPGDTVEPSIAALVGSLDSGPGKYRACLRIQVQSPEDQRKDDKSVKPKPKEIIVELKDMVKEVLLAFYRYTNKKKPESIIFYRDGVSEGEFKQVLKCEFKEVREACEEIDKDYKPPITFIVVNRRHHTRFIPEDKRDYRGKAGNVPPGTTVDTEVTHPLYSDYFLCSHIGIQGTSRPAHYTVLWDDNKFSADELQTLTYYLCYTYARCTRSISVPCPVMYAHLAAYRAKQYLYHLTKGKSNDTPLQQRMDDMKAAIRVVEKMKSEMYFA